MVLKLPTLPELWAGDDDSYLTLFQAVNTAHDNPAMFQAQAEQYMAQDAELEDMLVDAIYSEHGNTAVLDISGPLVAEDSFWNLIFGMVSYNTISMAMQRALDDANIANIVMSLSTGGGDVNGLEQVSDNIRVVKENKPVYAHTGTSALSAGYWLASLGEKTYATRMANVGSIGVISTFTSISRALKEKGVDVEIFRAGKYKALAHPAEPLSETAKEIIQTKTEKLYDYFLDHVSANRPALKVENKELWAEGRVFFASDAKEIGMVDEIKSLNQLLAELNSDANSTAGNPRRNSTIDGEVTMGKKVILSPEDAAAVASGASLSDIPHEELTEEELKAKLEAGEIVLEGDEAETKAEDEGDEPEVKAEDAEEGDEPATSSDMVAFLKSELKEARNEMVAMAAKNAELETKLAEALAAEELLKPIAVEAAQRMQIGLGQSPTNMEGLPAATVAEQYRSVKETFEQRISVGRKTLEGEEAEAISDPAVVLGIVPKSS